MTEEKKKKKNNNELLLKFLAGFTAPIIGALLVCGIIYAIEKF